MEILSSSNFVQPNARKNLTNEERQAIFAVLLKKSENGKLKKGSISATAKMFSVCVRTVQRIWQQAMTSFSNGFVVDVSDKKPKRVGRKRVQIDCSKVSEIPLRQRTNIRSLSFAMQVAKSTLHRRIKEGFIRPHSNVLKPYLSEENKKARLMHCLSMLEPSSLHNMPIFCNMFNHVHIDEK
ncbi:uncharacterized protein LOC132301682 [Cornus florida]|uniref:uncharacterized protein LOC132301682 n=1 Tax=Cornus florida TaxID=4283 RepID=UPI00289DDD3C|nr:uncharacterized protein LOC132301682 [Cornus florida]